MAIVQLHLKDFPYSDEISQLLLKLCVIPKGFELELFKRHINKPELRKMSDAIDFRPDDLARFDESSMVRLNEKYERFPPLQLQESLFRRKNGVVDLRFEVKEVERTRLLEILSGLFDENLTATGHFLYPPQGFKEWHTNIYSTNPGWRLYLVAVREEHQSYFRYVHRNRLHTIWDSHGGINIFKIEKKHPFWHAIKSEKTYRWSFGFALPNDWMVRLIRHKIHIGGCYANSANF